MVKVERPLTPSPPPPKTSPRFSPSNWNLITNIMNELMIADVLTLSHGIIRRSLIEAISSIQKRLDTIAVPHLEALKKTTSDRLLTEIRDLKENVPVHSPEELRTQSINIIADLLRPFPFEIIQELTQPDEKNPYPLKQKILKEVFNNAIHLYGDAYLVPDHLQMLDEELMKVFQEQAPLLRGRDCTPTHAINFMVQTVLQRFAPKPKVEAYMQVRIAGMGSSCWSSQEEPSTCFEEFPTYLPLEWMVRKKEGEVVVIPYNGRILHLKISHEPWPQESTFEAVLKEWYVLTPAFKEYFLRRITP